MENLQRVDTRKWQQYPVLQALYDDLPAKPYCTPVKGVCYVNPKELAIQEHYIQPNHPAVTRWLCFDIDHPDALFTYYYNNLQIIVTFRVYYIITAKVKLYLSDNKNFS